MNKTYRNLWNPALGAWVAVSEHTRSRGKRAGTVVLAAALAMPFAALANGGDGGGGMAAGGGVGAASGNAGGNAPVNGFGGGGGGAGGAGGAGARVGGGGSLGGLAGSAPGADGFDGAAALEEFSGGGGGGGGSHGYAGSTLSSGNLTGGRGGAGGAAYAGPISGGGGGGGEGGFGAAITNGGDTAVAAGQLITGGGGGNGGATSSEIGPNFASGAGGDGGAGMSYSGHLLDNAGTLKGGDGGNGGNASGAGPFAPLPPAIGGAGGAGLRQSDGTLLNSGNIIGGNGGASGLFVTTPIGGTPALPAPAEGGVGVVGSNLNIVNIGVISGGYASGHQGDPNYRAAAIVFTGGTNRLELRRDASFGGVVDASRGTNTLALGGTDDRRFDVSLIGNAGQFRGFASFEKTGTANWILDNTTTAVTPWTLRQGTLTISSDASLGDVSGKLTLDGGTLQTSQSIATSRAIAIGANGGAVEVDLARVLTLNGTISGGSTGTLVKSGQGRMELNAASTYGGGTSVVGGELHVGITGALGTGPVSVGAGTALVFNGASDAAALKITAGPSDPGLFNAGSVQFNDNTSAGSAQITLNGGTVGFKDNATAGQALIDNYGGSVSFAGQATIGQATIVNHAGGETTLFGDIDAGRAKFVNQSGGVLDIWDQPVLGQATFVNQKGGLVVLRNVTANSVSIGSLEGGGNVLIGAKSLVVGGLGTSTEVSGVISGTGGSLVKVGTGALTLSGANTYTGGTTLRQGRLNVGSSQALGTGTLSMDDDTTLGFSADGLTIANTIHLTGQLDPIIDTGAFSGTLSGAISGGGFITKEGTGTLTLSGANTYTGATNVAQGTLRAGAANTFSAASAHSVAAGATLDLAGFNQTLASLANSGTVSLAGAAAGTTLTVNGNYVGNNGVLKLGTALNGTGPSDRLVINGGTASGKTSVQIANLGGLGALTTGNGIEVVTAQNGAKTTAQTTKDAFSLAGGHVDAGAYEYRLYAADASGAGESWYLRSSTNAGVTPANPAGVPVATYRAEASLYATLPNQLRQGSLAMLGDLRKRVGDDDVKGTAPSATGAERRAWARVLSTDIDIQQGGAVSPTSKGRLTGFQAGTDLLATPNWRAGIYVGQLDGDARVNGFASGIQNLGVGRNDLRSQYVGVYGTYTSDSGFYADAVVQSGRHRYTIEPLMSIGAAGKGNSLLGSIEVGQAFPIGSSGWTVEPQLQLIHQHMDLSNSAIVGAIAQPQADSGWVARAGVRVKGQIDTGMGALQPYGRFNVYKTSSGADIARFVNGATTTDIAAPTGGTSTELAGGFTLGLNASTSLYGEVGKLWSSGGDAKVKSGISGSLGVRVKW